MVRAFVIGLLAAGLLAACSGSQSQPAAAASLTVDPLAIRYTSLEHRFWADYVSAEYVSPGKDAAAVCLEFVDMKACAARGQAMIPVLQKFLTDLGTTPAPAKFAADDATIRHQLPIAIADLKATVEAGLAGNKDTFTTDINAYVNDMVPAVTGALNHVDPTVVHV